MRRFRQRIKRIVRILLGRDVNWKIQCQQTKERFGSDFGGWSVATEILTKDSVIYSVGVGEDISFDLALIDRFGVTIYAFDPTPRSIEWVRRQSLPDGFVLCKYGLADLDGEVVFNPPENPEHISHTILDRPAVNEKGIIVPVKKLETIMKDLGHNRIDVLKMDIEGAEYQVIQDLSQSNIRPSQILVEFHHRFLDVGLEKTRAAITQLNDMGYCLFSVSDSGEEFGFIFKSAFTNVTL